MKPYGHVRGDGPCHPQCKGAKYGGPYDRNKAATRRPAKKRERQRVREALREDCK